ncbi:DUF4184 family protein [Streptomyces sudanensis]|uniref:DUF4184 family protein n=1 Tax=Streptomyces sudanensis TaxID=436397 RepID=UPI0020CC7C08|nr:DUF4184 family protein [Streptomyces sudanensis]MCP9959387.1 DUF4184 family protein [Streptomyces sudanensis]MCQ0000157.1 DUF4184 family protein [Streptomyces sudanensis]
MPFTLSHAAAVLPAMRRSGAARGPLVASALVAGSFSPDMTYFADSVVPGAMALGEFTHGVWGLLTADPLTAALLVGVWLMVREPLVVLLPGRWQGRVRGVLRGRPWRGRHPVALAAWFYASAVAGAATHVGWDLFTHPGRWGVRMLPVLGETAGGLPVYLYVQYGGSAVALAVLVWFGYGALRRVPAEEAGEAGEAGAARPALTRRDRWLAGGLLGGCVAAGVVHRCVRWYAYWGRIETPLDIVPTACFGAGAGLAAGLVVYGAGMRLRARAASRP